MYEPHIAETLDEALEQPIVILKTEAGFYDYADLYIEHNYFLNKDEVIAFFKGADGAEEHFDPAEYGKTWVCIVFDLPKVEPGFIFIE